MTKKITLYIYNSYRDPLFQSNMYKYMIDAAEKLGYQFLLITYEQEDYPITQAEKSQIAEDLQQKNITWIPLKWHSGKLKLIKKIYDLLLGFLLVFKYRLKGYNKIVSLATVSGSFAYIYSVLLGMSHYLYQYEPHSEFMSDFGYWSKKSLSFRLLNQLEYWSGKYSKIVGTGTIHMINRLNEMNTKAEIVKIPSCVDEELFIFDDNARDEIRSKLGVEDRPVMIYVGKFGGIYYEKEAFELMTFLKELRDDFFFLILTPNSENEIEKLFESVGIGNKDYFIGQAPYEEVHHYMSASDIGLVAVPPFPSQQFRSPIKVGEYLCCGIPYVVCKGISEDDLVAENYQVGAVLSDFTRESIKSQKQQILGLITEDKETQRKRCRNAGIEYRGYKKTKTTSIEAFKLL